MCEERAVSTYGLSLGTLLGDHVSSVEQALINGRFNPNWPDYIPRKGDKVSVVLKTNLLAIPAVSTFAASSAIASAVVTVANAILMAALSIALSMAIRALSPQPKQPKLDGTQSFGISGFQNTTGQGVAIPVWYGLNRVRPHIIASGVDLTEDHKNMIAKVLYCIGDSGGDEYQSVTDCQINEVPVTQYPKIRVDVRLGNDNQTVIPEFESVDQLWFANIPLVYDENTETGQPATYTTKSTVVNRARLIFVFPQGLWRANALGAIRHDSTNVRIRWTRLSQIADPNSWVVVPPGGGGVYGEDIGDSGWFHYEGADRTQFFQHVDIDFSMNCPAAANRYWADYPDVAADSHYNSSPPAAYKHYVKFGFDEGRIWHSELCAGDQYVIEMLVMLAGAGPPNESHAFNMTLFNVQETVYSTVTYPGMVLAAVTGIPSEQIPNLQQMDVSFLVEGKRVKIPQPGGGYALAYTRQRCWIVRDMMTNPRVGMGYEFDDSDIDDAQWLLDAQSYYDDNDLPAHGGGTEYRDLCDLPLTQRRWDWDWVKRVAGEGRGRIFPGGQKWKYVIDKPGTPMLLYAEPGNIIEDSIKMEQGPPDDDPFNQIVAEFRDSADQYRPGLTDPIDADPLNPPPAIIQKAVSYETITRESQALREIMIVIKKQSLETWRWSFASPMAALVSEPMDIDWLSERILGDIGAYAGTVGPGSTTTQIMLNQVVTLDPDIVSDVTRDYLLILQRKGVLATESRNVSNAAGSWASLTVTSPFTTAPAEGDVWAFGEQNVDHYMTRAQDITVGEDGKIGQIRSIYVPAVYTPDPLPSKAKRKRFALDTIPPIQLRSANVFEEIVNNRDGSYRSVIYFDVTPGIPVSAGVTWAGGGGWSSTTAALIDHGEPNRDDYFVDAEYYPTTGNNVGLHRRITGYSGGAFQVVFEIPFPNAIFPSENYEIRWPKYGDFSGFSVEESQDNVIFAAKTTHYGTHWERDGGDQRGTFWYRFTPFNANLVENIKGRITVQVTLTGDVSPPQQPAIVLMSSQYKNVLMDIYLAQPVAEDLASIDVYTAFDEAGAQGVTLSRVGVTKDQVPSGGYLNMRITLNMEALLYNTVLFGWARTVDFTGNVSPWVGNRPGNEVATILRQVLTPDLGTGAVGTIQYLVNGNNQPLATAPVPPTLIGSVAITTTGKSVDILCKLRISNTVGGGTTEGGSGDGHANLYLTRGQVWPDNLLDTQVNTGMLMAADNPPPGTHHYSVWGESAGFVTGGSTCVNIKIKVQENKGGF